MSHDDSHRTDASGTDASGPTDTSGPTGGSGRDPVADAGIDAAATGSAATDAAAAGFGAAGTGARPSGQARLPKPDPAAAGGAAGRRPAGEAGDPHATMPIPAAPAVEHGGWRASGDTIDIDLDPAPRRRFAFEVPPYMKVAAVIAMATSFGALAGTFAATRFGPEPAAPVVQVAAADDSVLRATVAQLQSDLAGLRASVETSSKAMQAQTGKLADRLERAERAQAEPAQKLARLGEAIDRLEKRTAQLGATQAGATPAAGQSPGAPPTTLQAQAAAQGGPPAPMPAPHGGANAAPPALAPPATIASADVTAALGDPRPPAPPVLNGWAVRDVRRGIALIEGRYGLVEVETGDQLPGVGRIESIRKQDGRWMVVTSRGVILAR